MSTESKAAELARKAYKDLFRAAGIKKSSSPSSVKNESPSPNSRSQSSYEKSSRSRAPSPDTPEAEYYEILKIDDHRNVKGVLYYRVIWKNYTRKSWIPRDGVTEAAIKVYESTLSDKRLKNYTKVVADQKKPKKTRD
jgi:hypothetical protein